MNKINFDFLYPTITDTKSAKDAVKFGYVSALMIAAITTLNFLLKVYESNTNDIVYILSIIIGNILPMIILGYFIFRMSRIAAVLALLLCLFELFSKYENTGSVGMMPIFLIFFISSIRGTFLYRKFLLLEAAHNEVAKVDELR
jgi:hypothetical protein